MLAAYRSVDPQEHWWHLPDGRTLRVIANPQPKGGVTWMFENLTERIDLESRYNAAVRVQGETLDNLAEGVVVFGPDGRVRLDNPAFSRLWGLDPDFVKPNRTSPRSGRCATCWPTTPVAGLHRGGHRLRRRAPRSAGQMELEERHRAAPPPSSTCPTDR